jgi:molecular chaperone DnaJ
MRACETCRGSGARPGTSPETCARCRGSGQVVLQQGFFRISRPCDDCAGAGEVVRDRCPDCRGAGRVEGQQTVKVRVPPGVDEGTRLRLTGEGEAGIAGGPPGDLYVVIAMKPHSLFTRDGQDLHCEVPISFTQAALGAEIEVPTLDGKLKQRITEGAQSGKVIRLRGKGLPSLRSSARGDQHLHLFVEVPTRLSKRQRELLEELAEEGGMEVSPVRKGFLDKLRDLFE